MKSKRPVNLKLTSLAFPPMAIASILHRMSGVVLFAFFPLVLYILHCSLASQSSYLNMSTLLACPWTRLALWAFGSALIFHGLAGIRHLLSDLDFGESLSAARWTAYGVMGLSLVLIIGLGMLLW